MTVTNFFDEVDLTWRTFYVPLLPSMGQYKDEHTKQWAAEIASFDGFVIMAPEYNHGTPGALKNAITCTPRLPASPAQSSNPWWSCWRLA
jgi:NAD(P)H-dependent FMN reductase